MSGILTPMFRVSYPNIFKPKYNKLNNKNEFSVEAVFPKDADLTALKEAAKAALVEKFGADQTKWPKDKDGKSRLKSPFKDQGDKVKDGVLPEHYTKGAIFLTLKSTQRPGLVDATKQDIIDESEFYAGCYARAYVTVYAYDQAGNVGVNFGLQHLQKMKDGDPLGSRIKVEDAFAPVETEGSEARDTSGIF